ncbi:hypothetical protein ANO11243_010310 [Dothideomycetidae sp. 11243]|nr:hypothetical protein ANO11243_010310 [fungal sp. No.11243]
MSPVPAHSTCNPKYQKALAKQFSYPKAFCKAMKGLLTVAQIMEGCKCFTTPTHTMSATTTTVSPMPFNCTTIGNVTAAVASIYGHTTNAVISQSFVTSAASISLGVPSNSTLITNTQYGVSAIAEMCGQYAIEAVADAQFDIQLYNNTGGSEEGGWSCLVYTGALGVGTVQPAQEDIGCAYLFTETAYKAE